MYEDINKRLTTKSAFRYRVLKYTFQCRKTPTDNDEATSARVCKLSSQLRFKTVAFHLKLLRELNTQQQRESFIADSSRDCARARRNGSLGAADSATRTVSRHNHLQVQDRQ